LQGTLEHLTAIDDCVAKSSAHWKLHRMAAVDRNVLRLAIFELNHCPDIPVKVTLNEAIEIAKKFGSEESGAFVNGILDQIAKTVKK
jgi:N utilization substance protein B